MRIMGDIDRFYPLLCFRLSLACFTWHDHICLISRLEQEMQSEKEKMQKL